MEELDVEGFTSIDQVEEEIKRREEAVCRKVKLQLSIKDQKKDSNRAFNETIKVMGQEIDHELGVIDALRDRQKVLIAGLPAT